MQIRGARAADDDAIVALWERCELTRPWNDPHRDLARKRTTQADGLLVAVTDEGVIVGTVMAGYDGHRGWINYLAVDPAHRRQGLGRRLMDEARRYLGALGCPKINLQVRRGNSAALAFYSALGFAEDDSVSLGLRLVQDEAAKQ
jgi:ribosomal protein S18 acetylase RimI-like enzyme